MGALEEELLSTPTRTQRLHIDVQLGPGRQTLRVSVCEHPQGEKALVLALGFGGGTEPFSRDWWSSPPLSLPGEAIPGLIEALQTLTSEGEQQ